MSNEQRIIEILARRVLFLESQLDETVWTETALIGTLKELVPGFGPRFDQLRNAVKTMTSPRDLEELAELESLLSKRKQS